MQLLSFGLPQNVGMNFQQPTTHFGILLQLLFWRVKHLFKGSFPTFSFTTFINDWILFLLEMISVHCDSWPNSHKYSATNIDDDNTYNNDGCSIEDMILCRTNIKQWFHSPCYWNTWMFTFSFWFILDHLCIDPYRSSLTIFFSPLMLISHYWQYVSIALQHAQAIMIL
jgi:hypothetical protein